MERLGRAVTWVVVMGAAGLSACSATRDPAEPDSSPAAFIAERNRCTTANECTSIPAGCDLRCWHAVPVEIAHEARQRVSAQAGSQVGSCPVHCPVRPPDGVACLDGKCHICRPFGQDASVDCLGP